MMTFNTMPILDKTVHYLSVAVILVQVHNDLYTYNL